MGEFGCERCYHLLQEKLRICPFGMCWVWQIPYLHHSSKRNLCFLWMSHFLLCHCCNTRHSSKNLQNSNCSAVLEWKELFSYFFHFKLSNLFLILFLRNYVIIIIVICFIIHHCLSKNIKWSVFRLMIKYREQAWAWTEVWEWNELCFLYKGINRQQTWKMLSWKADADLNLKASPN